MNDDEALPIFAREMTVRSSRGRRVHCTVTGSRNDDGSMTFEVEDEEAPDFPPPPQSRVGRS